MTSPAFCCGQRAPVIASRDSGSDSWRRRRKCTACGDRWTTYEVCVEGVATKGKRLEWVSLEEQRFLLALRAVRA